MLHYNIIINRDREPDILNLIATGIIWISPRGLYAHRANEVLEVDRNESTLFKSLWFLRLKKHQHILVDDKTS